MKKTEPSEEEREKKKTSEDQTQWKRKGKKKPSEDRTSEKEEEKKSQLVKRCNWVGPLYVFNYKNVIELWVMEIENSQKVFSVFITHN